MPHHRAVVCEICEGSKSKGGGNKGTVFRDVGFDNIRVSKSLGYRMGIREKTYIAKIVEIAAAVLIGFCGGLGGEDILWTP